MPTIKTIPLESITLDERTQQRAGELDGDIISDYISAIKDGDIFPPVVLFFDGEKYWLADGHYRYYAEKEFGTKEINAEILSGSLRDAILYSFGANGKHGIRRTKDDILKSVTTIKNDPEWSKWSNRTIAKVCNVSHTYVDNWDKKFRAGNVATQDLGEHDHEPATGPAFAPEDKPESEEPIKPCPPRDTCKAGELDSLIDLLQEAYDLAVALKDDQIAVAVGAALNMAKCR
jgi:hypothetical protein